MTFILRLVLVACCISANSVAAVTLTDVLARYGNPQLGESQDGAGYEVSAGNARFQLQQGSVTPVLAGSDTIGMFLAGTGTFRYETANKDEFTAVRYNAKQVKVQLQ